jgi:hypothetical protein
MTRHRLRAPKVMVSHEKVYECPFYLRNERSKSLVE